MRKLIVLTFGLFFATQVNAALISRTYTYTSGNTMDANQNNTNENTIYNEFNGNITAVNLLDGTLTNAKMADTQLVVTKFASSVQSTFTWNNSQGYYRRPVLRYVSATTVEVENNTGTANQTCIQFPDEQRCVTEDTSTADKYRRFIITSTATFNSGTEDSGMTGAYAVNTWIAMYAVKSVINSSNFVISGTTNAPTQANYATLNTMYGTNGWLYLGTVRNGDGSASTSGILLFSQVGNFTQFVNKATGSSQNCRGIRMANTAGATSLTLAISSGTSGAVLPAHALNTTIYLTSGINPGTSINMQVFEVNTSGFKFVDMATGGVGAVASYWYSGIIGAGQLIFMRASNAESDAMDIFLSGFIDPALGVGYNPQL